MHRDSGVPPLGVIGQLHAAAIMQRRVRVLASRLASLIPPDAAVLDVGSGDGQVSHAVMRLRPDVTIRGVDVLVRPHTAIPTERFDGKRLPVADGGVDVVMTVDVLHHTDDPVTLLREGARAARRAVVVKDHLRDGRWAGATLRAMDWVGNASHGVRLPYNYLSRHEWDDAFRSAALHPQEWLGRLGLYPRPIGWVCERGLHFAARLEHTVD